MRNVQLLEEQVANDKAKKMYSDMVSPMPEPEIVPCTPRDNLKRIDNLHHKLCSTQRRLESLDAQLRALQRLTTDMWGIIAVFMVIITILVGYLLWRTAWL